MFRITRSGSGLLPPKNPGVENGGQKREDDDDEGG
jgi:hypothetical protein